MQHGNRVFGKDELFDRIWGMDALGDASTVTVHIARIREKIEENPSKPQYIGTVWGSGYKFIV
jgi:DNA-binding response OmpR family regulator